MIMKIPPVYEELLADEDLDEETRAMILVRIREDEVEVAKERAAAKRHRLKALADLSVLQPDARLKAGSLSRQPPAPEASAPRDGEKLQDTRDMLFLASLMERSHGSTSVLQCAPLSGQAGQGSWIYHLGEQAPQGYAIKQKLSARGIRRILRDSFYGFRKALGSKTTVAMTFSLGDVILRPAGSRGDKAFWEFVGRLYHPICKQGDGLLENLHTTPMVDFGPVVPSDLFICPLDGPVQAIGGKLTSPGWTWGSMVGREWRMALCPLCLGELAQTGYSMS